ncbi:hypothetical protein B0H12DRAFT_1279316 [Mycena haematopus]|nr:hypothetical protein B0H12DRAFT_1279316 [Mycena haematopus]
MAWRIPAAPRFEPHALQIIYFHVYGTLVDHESGIFKALQPLLHQSTCGFDRNEALSHYFDVESDVKQRTPSLPYPEILARAYEDLAFRLGLTSTAEESSAFASSLFNWPLFSHAIECVHMLCPFFQLVALLDMDVTTYAKTQTYALLGPFFAATFCWDGSHTYRPDMNATYPPLVYHDSMGIPRERRCVVSNTLCHDLEPACKIDIPAVWIKYPASLAANTPTEYTSFLWNTYDTLPDFVAAIQPSLHVEQKQIASA